MQKLVAYFKEKPKTFLVIVAVAVVLYAAAWMSGTPRPIAFDDAVGSIAVEESGYGYGGDAAIGMPGKAMPTMAPAPDVYSRNAALYYAPPTAGQTAADVDQRIIKTGYLTMVVDSVSDAAGEVGDLAVKAGGFVQSSSVTERGDGRYSGQVDVRVPVDKFEDLMEAVKGLATLVRHETSTGQDVTEQYTDLEAQLRNAKAQEEVYLEILKQAKSVEDILAVQERLGSIRAVIESLEGRIQYLANATAYSTISVTLEEEAVVRAPTKEFRLGAIVRSAVQTLVGAAQELVAGLITVVIVWGGILLPIGLVAWVVWKLWKRRAMRP